MKSGFIISIVIFFSIITVNGQLIENKDCYAFTEEPFFDEGFIKQNRIKSINGEIQTKGNLEVIKDAKLVSRYEFDQNGKLVMQYGSFNTMGSKDTTFITYIYDNQDNLVTKRTNDAYGFFSYNYEYDEDGRQILKTYCREENAGKDRYNFEAGKQYTIVKESYSYKDEDSLLIQSIYNNHDRIYQTNKYYYDDLDLLQRSETQFVISKKKSVTYYAYTDLGKVASKFHYKNIKDKANSEKWEYEYDELGNLTYIDYFKNDVHTTHKEVLYNPSTFMLKALLVQDVKSNFITIIKFQTTFYD